MSIKYRRILFYILLLLFLILGGVAVTYALGYRLDTSPLRLTKAGGLYIRSLPQNAMIWLDGKPIKNKSGLISNGTFLGGITPGTYKLDLYTDGYRDWSRDIVINPSLVTEIKHALLLPKESQELEIGPVERFWLADDKLIIRGPSGKITVASSTLPGDEVLGVSADGNFVLLRGGKKYYWHNISSATSTALDGLFGKQSQPQAGDEMLLDKDNGNVLFVQKNKIISLDPARKQPLTIATSSAQIHNLDSTKFWLAWAEFDAKTAITRIKLYDKLLQRVKEAEGLVDGKIKELAWASGQTLGIISERGEVYVYRVGGNKLEHIASDGRILAFDKNAEILAVAENKSLEIFSYRAGEDYWRFNLPNVAQVREMWWAPDGHNLILAYPEQLFILSLEDSGLQGLNSIIKTDYAKYLVKTGQIYYIKNNGVYRLNLPR